MPVAEAPPSEAAEAWANARPAVRNRARWTLLARPEQMTPEGQWNVWLYLAGRGAGKTRSAAEDMAYFATVHPGSRLGVIAPTYSDARDTCIEGESGLLACLAREEVETWNRSLGELVMRNGSRFKLFSGDEPDRLRGPQHHRLWFDELAAFRYTETWDLAMMGLRLGDHPQAVVTTTPRPVRLMRELIARSDVVVTRGSTFDNADNLAPAALESLRRRYSGTRLGRQELEGILLEEAEGALWKREWIEGCRVDAPPRGHFYAMALGLDPSDGIEEGDEQGSCLAGIAAEDHGIYVLKAKGERTSPREWLLGALQTAVEHGATLILEKNHGGGFLVDLLEQVMKDSGIRAPYLTVTASQGKLTRAEPVAMLYEQGANTGDYRIHHVGTHAQLEDQMCNAIPGMKDSPDVLDAAVWAISHLMGYSRQPHDKLAGVASYGQTGKVQGVASWQ